VNWQRIATEIDTHGHDYASNVNYGEVGMDETSMLYTEPSQEVGYNKPSALVTGIDLMAVLLKSEKS